MKILRLAAFVALTVCIGSCTPAQWQMFQQISTEAATYVADFDGTVNSILLGVQLASGDNAVIATIRALVIDAEAAVLAEAQTVDEQHTPLDTPAEIATAFSVGLAKWDAIVTQLNSDGLPIGNPASPTLSTVSSPQPDVSRLRELRPPRLVRAARPS
jgi:hypothetical protein